ncbi:MAG: glucose-6-phosphate dehydrogenase [Candidatus Melainabacteria bacterium]|nr:glucose-6-phosphate dehydrogenase [Candidatus Melainabacteria bacterium]
MVTTESSLAKNPLLEGMRLEKRASPFAMVILGAHGDLTKRKLIPALYALYLEDLLPKDFAILGSSRTKMTDDDFRGVMKDSVQKYASDLNFQEDSWAEFAKGLHYLAADVMKPEGFTQLSDRLQELKQEHSTQGNHIFYLSTAPSLYTPIVKGLASSGLASKARPNQAPWPRIIVEKPFGHDLQSAIALDEEIHEVFSEHQVYRIDHYLGKETVQNIMVLRFANGIFEPLWNQKHVDHVQITNAETLGVEGRGSYYEEAGNLRDMVQNHLLQLVSLVGMEPPISLDPEATRDEKAKVLKCLRPIDPSEVDQYAVRGQYGSGHILGQAVPGYREEEGVSNESNVETFTALKLYIDNWRWAGVPFYIRSGKRLAKSITEIAIHFKSAPHRLFAHSLDSLSDSKPEPNVLVIQIQPEEGISLKFATKQPGQTNQLRHLNMDFKYGTAFGVRSATAYERLIHDCLMGDPSLFSRTDQVEVCWQFIRPVLDAWSDKSNRTDFPNYAAGSWGPLASDDLIASTGHKWRRL